MITLARQVQLKLKKFDELMIKLKIKYVTINSVIRFSKMTIYKNTEQTKNIKKTLGMEIPSKEKIIYLNLVE